MRRLHNLRTMTLPEELGAMRLTLLGGHLGLDFVNTATARGTPDGLEFLPSYARLLAWCRHVSLIEEAEMLRLHRLALKQPDAAQLALAQALALRESLYRVFAGLVEGQVPPASALKPLNAALARLMPRRQLVSTAGGLRWSWPQRELDDVLGAPALAAAELLADPQLAKLRQCPGCGWFFLDTSRNHSRRWCSMAFCGSRFKSQRQYARKLGSG